jgi:cytochrome c biogenesis protein CcmG/thiol:disulfide interchange protein DsbE
MLDDMNALSRLSLLLFLSLAVGLLTFITPAAEAAPRAPNFHINKKTRLSDYRGRVVYLDFWASWCTPCQESFPWLRRTQRRYRKLGLRVITVNLDKDRKQARAFLRRYRANFPVVYDPRGRIAIRYGVKAMPSSYLIDRRGRIVKVHWGFRESGTAKLEARIRRLLKQR